MYPLTDKLYVSAQVSPADIAEAAALGINTLIGNRPDGEEPQQPNWATVAAWAAAAGIEHQIHQPVTAPTLNSHDAARFATTVAAADAPVLAYCRTATRCCLLWALDAVAHGTPVDDAIQHAARAGVDLSGQAARLQAAAR